MVRHLVLGRAQKQGTALLQDSGVCTASPTEVCLKAHSITLCH